MAEKLWRGAATSRRAGLSAGADYCGFLDGLILGRRLSALLEHWAVARKRAEAAAGGGGEAEDLPMAAGLVLLGDTIARVTAAVGVLACDEGGRRRFWCPDPMRRTCSVTAVTGWETLAACATVTPTPLARHLAVNALSRCAIRSAPLEDARQRGMCGGRRRTDTGTHASGGARLYFLTQDTCEGCPHFTALLTMMLVPPVGELSFASLNRAH